MCRIAGIINHSLPGEAILPYVKQMCETLAHGGPDDEGIYESLENHLVLGHRRLSIIDMSSNGHQPMSYASGRYIISYNGELYNYQELKQELLNTGSCFSTQSDTEVILAAYAAWGVKSFARFNGMFAFAIWDNQTRELVLARDPGGIKPLYYAFTKEGIAFASEVRAFKQVPYLQEPNKNWPVYFMAYGHLPEPVTLLKNVQPLEKGNYLIYHSVDLSVKKQSFFRYTFLEKTGDRQEAIRLVKDGLDTAVKRHLISDAPIGSFLSGGIDSSILTALADQQQQNLQAISIYFNDRQYSEKQYQDALKKRLSSNHHHQFLVNGNDFHSYLQEIMQSMDQPSCDGINTWFISKYARQSGLKAVLSGIGGDEIFGGYPSFKRINTLLALEKLPKSILSAGRLSKSRKMRRLVYLGIKGPIGRYLFLRGLHIPADIAAFLNADESEVWNLLQETPAMPNIDYLSAPNQVSWMEFNMYMQNQLLRDADVMSMAHGLEIRVPFLDQRFMETVLKIRSDIKYAGKPGKRLLIDSFKELLPEETWNRPKMGFAFPFKEWLQDDRYANAIPGKSLDNHHQQLKQGKLHWSQFFILMLMNQYSNG